METLQSAPQLVQAINSACNVSGSFVAASSESTTARWAENESVRTSRALMFDSMGELVPIHCISNQPSLSNRLISFTVALLAYIRVGRRRRLVFLSLTRIL